MLTIHDVEILDKKKLNIVKKKSLKTQIMLCDTGRRADDFLNKIKYRNNGNYDDIPHFLVTKLGMVYQLFDTDYSSITFNKPKIDKKIIKVAIENLGWLVKDNVTGIYNNWIEDPYRTEPFIRTWRNRFFWDKYNEDQMNSVSLLCDYICDKHGIFKQTVPSNGYLENVSNFKGITCKSNFSSIYTDINPSFNFRVFFNTKQNEQLRSDQKDVEHS